MSSAFSWSVCCLIPFLRRKKDTMTDDERKNLEHKMYLAKETPDPIFDLSDCGLHEVPKGIYAICKVFRKDQLILEKNYLKSLDDGGNLCDLSLLNTLNINHNDFKCLPDSIKLLQNLTEFYADSNNIAHLPSTFSELVNLKIVSLANNKLIELPRTIGNLQNLQYLNIKGNKGFTVLFKEICLARKLVRIDLDSDTVIDPPVEVTSKGTESILRYFCAAMDLEYVTPQLEAIDDVQSYSTVARIDKQTLFDSNLWEEQQKQLIQQEKEKFELEKKRKESILKSIIKEQENLHSKIVEIHESKEIDRVRLLKDIQLEEETVNSILNSFIKTNMNNPDRYQQQIEFEIKEHNRLLELCRNNNEIKLKNNEILLSMEKILEVETQQIRMLNSRNQEDLISCLLSEDGELVKHLEEALQTRESRKLTMIQELQKDEEMQKVAVASLLERADSQRWSLNQEIVVIANHLSRLTHLEMEKQKLKLDCNLNLISEQRVHLMNMLEDLFTQQKKRRKQLLEVLKEMESQQDMETNFWLIHYQRLINSTPQSMIDMTANLDPNFVNILLQENVIHCLPFLVKLFFSHSLPDVTEEQLKECGVTFKVDRIGVMNAVSKYLYSHEECKQPTAPSPSSECLFVASAPEVTDENECAVCMDSKSEIVFLPCAHLCCCSTCAYNNMDSCPICRMNIEKKIKVIPC